MRSDIEIPADLTILALESVVDPTRRHEVTIPVGTTVAAMVEAAYPGFPERQAMIWVVVGDIVVPAEAWSRVRPKAGTKVLLRPVPGDDVLRTVLTVAVTVAAIAAGQFYAPELLLALNVASTATSSALASAAISATTPNAGTMLADALSKGQPTC